MTSILPNDRISNSGDRSKMTDAAQELLSAEGDKSVSVRGSWTVPLGMYDDVKEQALKNKTDVSERQSSTRIREDSKETFGNKEAAGESLHLGEDRCSLSVQDGLVEQAACEQNSRKHKNKQSRDYDGKRPRRQDDDDKRHHGDRDSHERSHRHKDRRRSRSAEDRHNHHRSREEQVRHQRQRSRESQSREQSPQRSLERNNETFGGKNESSVGRDKTATSTSNGRLLDSISQSGFVRKPDRKGWEQEHSHKSVLKSDYLERSPYRDNETQNAHSNRCEEINNDQTDSKRRRSNSPERSKEVAYEDRGSRSDRRHQKHRSRSRSRSRGRRDRYKDPSSHQHRRRSRSRSCDNGHNRNRSKSLLRNSDAEPKPKTTERRPRSKSREQETAPVESRANSTVDPQRQSGEKDRWRKRRSRSRSIAKRSYENYGSRDRENRRSQSRDHLKNWPDDERQATSDYLKRRRSQSRSVERVWNSSNWEDRKRFREEFSQDGLPNSGGWSGYPERVTNNKYYLGRGDRQNSWMRGGKEDNVTLRDQSQDNFMPNRWRGNQDHIVTEGRPWDRDRKRDWDNYRHRQENKEDQDAAIDSGQQLEDMVTKSLAKLRRDSDREHRGADEHLKDVSGGEDDKISDKDRHCGEADRSAIPVLLSKKSAYKSKDPYDLPEAEDFDYDHAGKEDFARESDSCSLQSHDQQQQQGFSVPVKGRHLPVGQPRFHGDFREPPPPVRVDFPPRGKAMMQPPVAPGHFGIGARLMSGVVQLVTPIHLRPPPMTVDWRMMGQDVPGPGMFPISRPPPHVGPRGQLIQVGGFIRTPVPVEFLARHPVRPAHLPGPPFQSGPPHSLPPVHPGTSSQPSLIRPPHLQGDPRQLPPPPPPITLLHSSHQLRLPNQEPHHRLVDMRHLGPQPGLLSLPGLVPPHPPPNLTVPPPPLPIKLVGHGQREGQSVGYLASNQTTENLDAKSPSTPPPPPPPATSSAPQDPRLYSIKLLSHKPVPIAMVHRSSSSTSDESLDSEKSFLHCRNESSAQPKPSTKQLWQQQSNSPERPNSALSFGSDYVPQEITDEAYTEALFEEPYSFVERDASSVHVENSELNPRQEVSDDVPVSAAASTERLNIAEDAEFADVSSQAALEDETAQIPEIMNPMASPTVDEMQACGKSPSNASATDALATAATAAQSLQMIQVADLKKVLETVRTTTLSNEEEAKSQDKLSSRMDQIAEEVKLALKPHFAKSLINKDEYKDIMRKAVPKIFSSKSSLDRARIQGFVQEYVNKIVRSRKPDKAKKLVSQGHGLPKHSSKALSKAV